MHTVFKTFGALKLYRYIEDTEPIEDDIAVIRQENMATNQSTADASTNQRRQNDRLGEGPCKEIFATLKKCSAAKGAKNHMVGLISFGLKKYKVSFENSEPIDIPFIYSHSSFSRDVLCIICTLQLSLQ